MTMVDIMNDSSQNEDWIMSSLGGTVWFRQAIKITGDP